VTQAFGDERLDGIEITNNETGISQTVPAAALFLFIGAKPHTEFLEDAVARNAAGFVLTGPDLAESGDRPEQWKLQRDPYLLETSVPGIFAVGDVRQGVVRRVAARSAKDRRRSPWSTST
jgi:thioredoxin reductase (NADPH)